MEFTEIQKQLAKQFPVGTKVKVVDQTHLYVNSFGKVAGYNGAWIEVTTRAGRYTVYQPDQLQKVSSKK